MKQTIEIEIEDLSAIELKIETLVDVSRAISMVSASHPEHVDTLLAGLEIAMHAITLDLNNLAVIGSKQNAQQQPVVESLISDQTSTIWRVIEDDASPSPKKH